MANNVNQEYVLEVVTNLSRAKNDIEELILLLKILSKEQLKTLSQLAVRSGSSPERMREFRVALEDTQKQLGLTGARAAVFEGVLSRIGTLFFNISHDTANQGRILETFSAAFTRATTEVQKYIDTVRSKANTGAISKEELDRLQSLEESLNRSVVNLNRYNDAARRAFESGSSQQFSANMTKIQQEMVGISKLTEQAGFNINTKLIEPLERIQNNLQLSATGNRRTFIANLVPIADELNKELQSLQTRANTLRANGFTKKEDIDEFRDLQRRIQQVINAIDILQRRRENLSTKGSGSNIGFDASQQRVINDAFGSLRNNATIASASINVVGQNLGNIPKELQTISNLGVKASGQINETIDQYQRYKQVLSEINQALRQERQERANIARRTDLTPDQLVEFNTASNQRVTALNEQKKAILTILNSLKENFDTAKQKLVEFFNLANTAKTPISDIATQFQNLFGKPLGGGNEGEQRANAIREVRKELDLLSKSQGRATSDAEKAQKVNDQLAASYDRARGSVKDFDFFLNIAIQKIIRYRVAFLTMQAAIEQFRRTLTVPIEIETAFTKIAKVLDTNIETVKRLQTEAFSLGRTFGTEIKDIVGIMQIWAQQGKSVNEIIQLTTTTLLGMKAANLDANDAVELLTAATKVYNVSAEDSLVLFDKILNVERKFAVTTQDLAQALKLLGTGAEEFGIGMDSLFGTVTAIVQVTRKSGQQVGNALKTIFARFGQDDVVKALRELGIAVFDVEGNLKPLDGILDELAVRWNTLTGAQQLNLARLVGGLRHYNQFLILLDQYDVKLRATLASEENNAFTQKAAAKELETLGNQLTRLKVTLDQFVKAIGESDGGLFQLVRSAADFAESMALMADKSETFGNVLKFVFGTGGRVVANILALTAAVHAGRFAFIGFANLIAGDVLKSVKIVSTELPAAQKAVADGNGLMGKSFIQAGQLSQSAEAKLKLQAFGYRLIGKETEFAVKGLGGATQAQIEFTKKTDGATKASRASASTNKVLATSLNAVKAAGGAAGTAISFLATALGRIGWGIAITAVSILIERMGIFDKLLGRTQDKYKKIDISSDSLSRTLTNQANTLLANAETLKTVANRQTVLVGTVARLTLELDRAEKGSAQFITSLVKLRNLIPQISGLDIPGLRILESGDIQGAEDARRILNIISKDTIDAINEANNKRGESLVKTREAIVNLKEENKELDRLKTIFEKTHDEMVRFSTENNDFSKTRLKNLVDLIDAEKELQTLNDIDTTGSPRISSGIVEEMERIENLKKRIAEDPTGTSSAFFELRDSLKELKAEATDFAATAGGAKLIGDLPEQLQEAGELADILAGALKNAEESGKDFDLSKYKEFSSIVNNLNNALSAISNRLEENKATSETFFQTLAEGLRISTDDLSLTVKEAAKLADKFSEAAAEAQVFSNRLRTDVAREVENALLAGEAPDILQLLLDRTLASIKKSQELAVQGEVELQKEIIKRKFIEDKLAETREKGVQRQGELYGFILEKQKQIDAFQSKIDTGVTLDPADIKAMSEAALDLEAAQTELNRFGATMVEVSTAGTELAITAKELQEALNSKEISQADFNTLAARGFELAEREAFTARQELEKQVELQNDLAASQAAQNLPQVEYIRGLILRRKLAELEVEANKQNLRLQSEILKSITSQVGVGENLLNDIFEAGNLKLEARLTVFDNLAEKLKSQIDGTEIITFLNEELLNSNKSLEEVQIALNDLIGEGRNLLKEELDQIFKRAEAEDEILKTKLKHLAAQAKIAQATEKVNRIIQEEFDSQKTLFRLRGQIAEATKSSSFAIKEQSKLTRESEEIEKAKLDILIASITEIIKTNSALQDAGSEAIKRLTEMKAGLGDTNDQALNLVMTFSLIEDELNSASSAIENLASVFASIPQNFNNEIIDRFESIVDIEDEIATEEKRINELRKIQSTLLDENSDKYKDIKEEIENSEKELKKLNKEASDLKSTGNILNTVFSKMAQDLSNVAIEANTESLKSGLAKFFKDSDFGSAIADAFLSPGQREAQRIASELNDAATKMGTTLTAALDNNQLPARIEEALMDVVLELRALSTNANIQQAGTNLQTGAAFALPEPNDVEVDLSGISTSLNIPENIADTAELEKNVKDNSKDTGTNTKSVGKLTSAMISASALIGQQIILQRALANGKSATAVNLGSSLGGILGSGFAGMASGFLAGALPGIGTLVGGLLGSLFGPDRKPKAEDPDLGKFADDNTEALKESTEAIRTLTTEFQDLRDQLINAPARFIAPPAASIPSIGNNTSGPAGSQTQGSPMAAGGVVIQFNIQGGFDQSAARAAVEQIQQIYQKQARQDSANSRLFK